MDKQLNSVKIDLNVAANDKLNESFLRSFGAQIEWVLKRMFGLRSGDVKISGTRRQLDSFAKTLSGEKRYMEAYNEFGLGNEKTFQSKWQLDGAIKNFEKATGLKWPLN